MANGVAISDAETPFLSDVVEGSVDYKGRPVTRFKSGGWRSASFIIDDLPMWGFVGELHPDRFGDNKHVVYTHKTLQIQYKRDQIISINMTQEIPKPLEEGRALDMTYSVKWFPTNISYEERFNIYLDYYFFENEAKARVSKYLSRSITALNKVKQSKFCFRCLGSAGK